MTLQDGTVVTITAADRRLHKAALIKAEDCVNYVVLQCKCCVRLVLCQVCTMQDFIRQDWMEQSEAGYGKSFKATTDGVMGKDKP